MLSSHGFVKQAGSITEIVGSCLQLLVLPISSLVVFKFIF
jgi:hypothetical protein